MKVPTIKTTIKTRGFVGMSAARANIHAADASHDLNIRLTKNIQSSVAGGFGDLGKAIGVTGKIYQDMEAAKQKARDETDSLDYLNGMRKATGMYLDSMSTNPDYNSWNAGYNESMNDYHSTFMKDRAPSKASLLAIKKSADHYKTSNDINIAHSSMKADNKYNMDRLSVLQSDAMSGSTLATVDESFAAWEAAYDSMGNYVARPPEVVEAEKETAKSQIAYVAWNRAIKSSPVEMTGWKEDTDLQDKEKVALENSVKKWKVDQNQAKIEETRFLNDNLIAEVVASETISDEYIDLIPETRPDIILKARNLQKSLLTVRSREAEAKAKASDKSTEDQIYLLLRKGDPNDPNVSETIANLQLGLNTVDGLKATDTMLKQAKSRIGNMSDIQKNDRKELFRKSLARFAGKDDDLSVYDEAEGERWTINPMRIFYGNKYKPIESTAKEYQAMSNIQKSFDIWASKNPDWTRAEGQEEMARLQLPYAKEAYKLAVDPVGSIPRYSQEDLEFTANKHGITIQELKKRLGQ